MRCADIRECFSLDLFLAWYGSGGWMRRFPFQFNTCTTQSTILQLFIASSFLLLLHLIVSHTLVVVVTVADIALDR